MTNGISVSNQYYVKIFAKRGGWVSIKCTVDVKMICVYYISNDNSFSNTFNMMNITYWNNPDTFFFCLI